MVWVRKDARAVAPGLLGSDSGFPLLELFFGAEPVVQLMTGFPAAGLIQLIGAETDLVFEFLWFACHDGRRFLGGKGVHDEVSFGGNLRRVKQCGQLPKIGAGGRTSRTRVPTSVAGALRYAVLMKSHCLCSLRVLFAAWVITLTCVSSAGQNSNPKNQSVSRKMEAMAFTVGRWTVGHEWVLEIHILDAQHRNSKVLVTGADPAWSPDTSRLAYCDHKSGEGSEIFVIARDGSKRTQLTKRKGGSYACSPTWSPDGKEIAFSGRDVTGRGSAIFIMEEDGSNVHRITDGNGPSWSPDGKQLAFYRAPKGAGTKSSIWVTNIDGSEPIRLTDETAVSWQPNWTPDGKILFASDREGKSAIYVASRDGANLQRLAYSPKYGMYAPVISPDGSQLVMDVYAENNESTITLLHLRPNEEPQAIAAGTHPAVVWTH